MFGNPQLEFKTVDAHTIEVEAKEITDEHIYKLEAIRKKLDTYNIKEMIWFEYDYEPYNSWGESENKLSFEFDSWKIAEANTSLIRQQLDLINDRISFERYSIRLRLKE